MANTQEIVEGFQNLTQEQRMIAQQLNKVDSEKSEHAVTIEALKDIDAGRQCYRLVGGVLMERTVGEVMPALKLNLDRLTQVSEELNKKIIEKGKEILAYQEKHKIRITKGDEGSVQDGAGGDNKQKSSSGVLVK